ncbi:MAG: hypothetical protein AAF639_41985 [Chloroflexota bacterium]
MSTQPPRYGWLIGAIVVISVAIAIYAGFFQQLNPTFGANSGMAAQPGLTGGVLMPTATPDASQETTMVDENAAALSADLNNVDSHLSATNEQGIPQLLAGLMLSVNSRDGRGLSLYSDIDQASSIMHQYMDGTVLTLLDPSGDYEGLPIQTDTGMWVRLRADDGLVGWANLADLAVVDE